MLSQQDMRNILRHRCEEAGGQAAWGRKHGFTRQMICNVLAGNIGISKRMAEAIGYRQIVVFCSLQTEEEDA